MELFLLIFILLILIDLALFIWLWGLYEVKFRKAKFTWAKILYTPVKWPYSQSWKFMDLIYYLLKDSWITTYKWIWVYFDNPKEVKSENLRSIVWCVIEKKDYKKVDKILLENDVKLIDLAETSSINTKFPYKNKLSIILSIFKVYPKIRNYLEEKDLDQNVDIMEIYDIPNKTINYKIFDNKFFKKIKQENFK